MLSTFKNHCGLCKICFFLGSFLGSWLQSISFGSYFNNSTVNILFDACKLSYFFDHFRGNITSFLGLRDTRCRHLPRGGQSTSCKENPVGEIAVCMAEIQPGSRLVVQNAHDIPGVFWYTCQGS